MKSQKLRRYQLELDGVRACSLDGDGCILSDGTCTGGDSSCVYYDGDCDLGDHGCIYYDECGPTLDTQGCKWSADYKIIAQLR